MTLSALEESYKRFERQHDRPPKLLLVSPAMKAWLIDRLHDIAFMTDDTEPNTALIWYRKAFVQVDPTMDGYQFVDRRESDKKGELYT